MTINIDLNPQLTARHREALYLLRQTLEPLLGGLDSLSGWDNSKYHPFASAEEISTISLYEALQHHAAVAAQESQTKIPCPPLTTADGVPQEYLDLEAEEVELKVRERECSDLISILSRIFEGKYALPGTGLRDSDKSIMFGKAARDTRDAIIHLAYSRSIRERLQVVQDLKAHKERKGCKVSKARQARFVLYQTQLREASDQARANVLNGPTAKITTDLYNKVVARVTPLINAEIKRLEAQCEQAMKQYQTTVEQLERGDTKQ